jgi:hypothetical protein
MSDTFESPHIFLSYCREDAAIMRRLRDDLRAAGLAVWSDESLDPGTTSWQSAVGQAIEGAGAFVIILSPDAKQSRWVERELTYADARKVRLFPVLARGDETSAVPLRLINAQWTDIRTESAYAEGVRNLVDAIAAHIGQKPGTPSPADYSRAREEARSSFLTRWWRVGVCLFTVLTALIFDIQSGGVGSLIGLLLMGIIGVEHLAKKRARRGGLSLLAAGGWCLYLIGAGEIVGLLALLGTLAALVWEAVVAMRGEAN